MARLVRIDQVFLGRVVRIMMYLDRYWAPAGKRRRP